MIILVVVSVTDGEDSPGTKARIGIVKRILDGRPSIGSTHSELADSLLAHAGMLVLEKLNKRPRPFVCLRAGNVHALSGQLAHIWILVLKRLDQRPVAAR